MRIRTFLRPDMDPTFQKHPESNATNKNLFYSSFRIKCHRITFKKKKVRLLNVIRYIYTFFKRRVSWHISGGQRKGKKGALWDGGLSLMTSREGYFANLLLFFSQPPRSTSADDLTLNITSFFFYFQIYRPRCHHWRPVQTKRWRRLLKPHSPLGRRSKNISASIKVRSNR